MANTRRSDYGEEFVERLRKDRFKKAYILVNGLSSGDEEEEDEEELCFEDEDDEIASYTLDPPRPPPSVHSSRRPPSVVHSQRGGGSFGFDARDLYFFGVLSELTDKFTPERTARLIAKHPPPAEFRSLVSIERVAYLLYFSLYGRYLSVGKFHNVFNREYFKYTSAGDSERVAFLKICRITFEEYKRRAIEHNKRAYKLSQKHLFSDGQATPDSRLSDRPSMESEDVNSIDSLAKELMFYRSPHTPVRFGRGGKIIYVDPVRSVSTVCVEDLKRFFRDAKGRRYVEILESFKGPLLVGHTPSQTPLLFIQCQINRLLQSDVYRANPSSGDANDCLLIWSLLEMLIRQHGKVTGPDLARLLCANQPNHLAALRKGFLKSDADTARDASAISRQDSSDVEQTFSTSAMERVTQFLLGGHIDEAIDSAIGDGLLFDALLLAHRLFRDDRDRLDAVEARLMAYRSPQHPITTLLSVAANQPVPLLTNPTSYETNGWRSHIAIVLANLQNPTAMSAVYQLGLALAQKEFNSAADFCFLAVNLLCGFDCFQEQNSEREESRRRSIRLINATLPDDETNSFQSRFGWSVLDYQATELFDFALQLANPNNPTLLSKSNYYTKARLQYAQLLDELGGFKNAVELYRLERERDNQTPTNTTTTNVPIDKPPTNMPIFKAPTNAPTYRAPTNAPTYKAPTNAPTDKPSANVPFDGFAANVSIDKPPASVPTDMPSASAPTDKPPADMSFDKPPTNVPTDKPPANMQTYMLPTNVSIDKPPPTNVQTYEPLANLPIDKLPTNVSVDKPPPTNVQTYEPLANLPTDKPPAIVSSDKPPKKIDKSPTNVQTDKPANTQPTDKLQANGPTDKPSFLLGFFSKIKAPAESNEMKLPEDKNPKIVWDPQLGRYIDQEQKQQLQEEELAPPPVFPVYQPPQWQQAAQPTDNEQQQRPAAPVSSRAFQGKSRYANAWNS